MRTVKLRLDDAEHKLLERVAAEHGLTCSAAVRFAVRKEARELFGLVTEPVASSAR